MDFVSHGLWGGLAFGRKNRKIFLVTFLLSIMPDALSFGIVWVDRFFKISEKYNLPSSGSPFGHLVPDYVYHLYNFTNSLFIFAAVFFLVWLVRKKPFLPLLGWLLHILVDIPTHSFAFFPTPFLWPVSDFKINGINWGDPRIFFPDLILLVIGYTAFYVHRKIKQKKIKEA